MAQAAFYALTAVSVAESVSSGVQANEFAKLDAERVKRVRGIEERSSRRARDRLIASQRAAFAANDIEPDLGSPMDVLGDTVVETERQIMRDRYERTVQAQAIEQRGEQALTQAITGGLGTVLGAAAFHARPD